MITLNISGQEYKIKFVYNNFADTDLLERVQDVAMIMNGKSTDGTQGIGILKDLFVVVRELVYVGCQKFNPISTLQEVGDLLEAYKEEAPLDENGEPLEDRGLLALFVLLSNELLEQGFLPDLMAKLQEAIESENGKVTKIPQDRKRKTRK